MLKPFLFAPLAALLLAGTAFAQEPAPLAEPESAVPTAAPEPAVAGAAADAEDAPVEMPLIEVIGKPERKKNLPGSAQVLDHDLLEKSRVMTTNEALRKAAGVNVRDEEGIGLRPNIGIRGLNPTRSTKVLLLEDGIPLAYAPYGDNASYYHPPVERFDRIEVLKGAAQNLYGPQTLGGVINYITPAPPALFSGGISLAGGNREYLNARGFLGGNGMLLDYARKQSDGARDNVHSDLNDVNYKAVLAVGRNHALTARANFYSEDSQVGYSGLTDAEFAILGARYNPFKNDEFKTDRQGVSFTHELSLTEGSALTTNAYASRFNRHWWRQSSTTTDTQCNASYPAQTASFQDDRLAGVEVDPDLCASVQGRLREYYAYGVEPRLRLAHAGGELETGVRVHYETQDRIQENGIAPTARDGTVAEDNARHTTGYAAFLQNRFEFGAVALTPSVRVEHVRFERTNRLTDASGKTDLTEVLPGLGATWALGEATTAFAGVHRGFAPPRTEDILTNTGTSVDLDAEESWNAELGLRARPVLGLTLEATAFRNDFSRQISVGSIAGGGVPLATGESLYQGVELQGRADFGRLADSAHNPYLQVAYAWLPTADQESAFIRVDNGTAIPGSAEGNRLPYAPEDLVTMTAGYAHPTGFDASVEAVFVGSQFADFANLDAPTGNGQFGEIASYTVWNAAVNYRLPTKGFGVFVTAKNLFDKVYIVDRTRGILPGAPRLVQAGVEYTF